MLLLYGRAPEQLPHDTLKTANKNVVSIMSRAIREIVSKINEEDDSDLTGLLINCLPMSSASLLLLIGKKQPIRVTELSRLWGKSDRQTSVATSRLATLGLIEKRREGRAVYCAVTNPDLLQAINRQ